MNAIPLRTNISAEALSAWIDRIVRERYTEEERAGPVQALETAIKDIHGAAAFIYGRFGDMTAAKVLQQILDGIAESAQRAAPEVKQ